MTVGPFVNEGQVIGGGLEAAEVPGSENDDDCEEGMARWLVLNTLEWSGELAGVSEELLPMGKTAWR